MHVGCFLMKHFFVDYIYFLSDRRKLMLTNAKSQQKDYNNFWQRWSTSIAKKPEFSAH